MTMTMSITMTTSMTMTMTMKMKMTWLGFALICFDLFEVGTAALLNSPLFFFAPVCCWFVSIYFSEQG
jgi:hypothetical protein